jgi:hypothetical protein
MKAPSPPAKPSPVQAARAKREAAEAEALRANLARRKAQARAQTTQPAPEKDPKCP